MNVYTQLYKNTFCNQQEKVALCPELKAALKAYVANIFRRKLWRKVQQQGLPTNGLLVCMAHMPVTMSTQLTCCGYCSSSSFSAFACWCDAVMSLPQHTDKNFQQTLS